MIGRMARAARRAAEVVFAHLGLKVGALGVAAVFFVLTRNEVTRAFEVPLRVSPDPARVLLTELPQTVNVKVRGPWARVNRLQDYDLGTAEVDLRIAAPGPLQVDRASIVMPSGVWLAGVQYPHVDLRFEPVVVRSKPIEPMIVGRPAAGFTIREIEVEPPTWELRGGRSAVQAVTTLTTDSVRLEDARDDVHASLAVVVPPGELTLLYPDAGKPHVQVRVGIEPVLETRAFSVPIPISLDLDPLEQVPRSVTVEVAGPQLAFAQLDALGLEMPIEAVVTPRGTHSQDERRNVDVQFKWAPSVPARVQTELSLDHAVASYLITPWGDPDEPGSPNGR